ncbi:hypothetical protein BS162P1_00053 [Bacteroides phage BS162P1]|jgi:hypothetical protein|nr:hypothetical protein BS162P1_00053 [Bacteroides phage BS162P1]DAV31150.1 MAG TPA: PTS system glucitol/sorbitol-specific IIA component [Caudoviricetes sp.]
MKELPFGEPIQTGDKVRIGDTTYPVVSTTRNFSCVLLNKKSYLTLPRIYTKDFVTPDETDVSAYRVFRD